MLRSAGSTPGTLSISATPFHSGTSPLHNPPYIFCWLLNCQMVYLYPLFQVFNGKNRCWIRAPKRERRNRKNVSLLCRNYISFYCFRYSMVETTLWKKPSLEILPWSKRGRLTKLETLFSGTNYFFNIYLSLKLSCSFSRNGRLEQCQDLCYHI